VANEVNLTVRISDNGTLDIVAKKSKAAAKATDELGASTEKTSKKRSKYHKGEKGVAGATANSTKAFSKMNQSMTGSSGLVGAYATLAANVFAATAAFGALQRAAEFAQLEQSVAFFGDSAGRNLDLVVSKLKAVTDNALSTEQALRSAALATASGFSTKQLEELAEVADGASKALGRDLTDSFDRLVRGAAKLEPEILDELGIMVRLDDAVEQYAISIGKSTDSLSQFERRQAFLNATIEAGREQFGQLRDSVDTNPYNQLAAAFNNLVKEGIGFLNTFLRPVVDLLANNQVALAGSLALFASTISRTMLPALAEQSQAMADVATQTAENSKQQLQGLNVVGKSTTKYNKFLDGLKDGSKGIGDYKEGLTSLNRTISQHETGLEKMTATSEAEKIKLKDKRVALAAARVERTRLITSVRLHQTASSKLTATLGLENLAQGNLSMGFKTLGASISQYMAAQTVSGVKNTLYASTLNVIKTGAFAAMLGVRALGQAFFALLGPIGLLISFGPLLYDFFAKRFFPEDETKKKFEEIRSGTERAIKVEEKFVQSTVEGSKRQVDGQKKALGLQLEVANSIQKTIDLERELAKDTIDQNNAQIISTSAKITQDKERLRYLEDAGKLTRVQRREERQLKAAIETNLRILDTLNASNKSTFTSLGQIGPEAIESIKTSIEDLKNSPKVAEFMSPQIAQLEEFLKLGSTLTKNELLDLLESIQNDSRKGSAFLTNLTGTVQKFSDEQSKLGAKVTSPYDKILDAAKGVRAEFTNIEELTPELRTKLENMGFDIAGEEMKKAFGGEGKEFLDKYIQSLEEAVNRIKLFPNALAKNKQAQKDVTIVANEGVAALEKSFQLRNEGFKLRQQEIDDQKLAINQIYQGTEALEARGKELLAQQDLRQAQLDGETKYNNSLTDGLRVQMLQADQQKAALDLQLKLNEAINKSLDIRTKAARVQAKINNISDPKKRSSDLTAADELAIFQKFRKERETAVAKEYELRIKVINSEALITELKFQLVEEQLRAAGLLDKAAIDNFKSIRGSLKAVQDQQKKNAEDQRDLSLNIIQLEGEERKRALIDAAKAAMTTTGTLFEKFQSIKDTLSTDAGDGNTGINNMKDLLDSMDPREKLGLFKESVSGFIEEMSKLGPDGEFIASMAQGVFTIADSFVTLGEQIDKDSTKMEKFGAVANTIANVIGAVNNILQAGYQRNIATIEEQIEAEKKRDGKSKASLQKIAQMEKKKEAQARKAFEVNKKMMIAQAIASTAAGVVGALGSKPWGPWNFALAGLVAAMGAAQVAIIAGTSFQGGGSGESSSAGPSSISLGKRASAVDMAKTKSASGELGYLRGESGTGGPQNFKPSFAGRYRAEGGSAGLVVGEQGPELFVPEVPGRVVPNEDVGMGGASNVTFNISTVDAAGVEELLVSQRGNIIGMLREASNSYGKPFMEGVSTSVYTPESAGVRSY